MNFVRNHPAVRILLMLAAFLAGMALLILGWTMTGQLAGLGLMLLGLALLLATLWLYNVNFR
ncbi:MAG: DUF6903 family protein [Candidatus Avoscillospira sp.]